MKGIIVLWMVSAGAFGGVLGNLRGIVHDPDHRPIPQARVAIRAAAMEWSSATQTNAEGAFTFPALPIGTYDVTVTRDGFGPAGQRVVVGSSAAPILHVQLKLAVLAQSVETSEEAQPVSSDPTTVLTRGQIERTPGADRTNSLAAIADNVPGAYVIHDQLHVRGGHQVTWLVDGVPVPNTSIASNVGPQFDPKDADTIEVQTGGYSAEYGDRTYGVFNVVPRTGFERNREGELVASYGSFRQTNDQLSFGSHTERFAWYGSVNGNRSDLGLETPAPQVLHDNADGLGAFSTLVFNADPANQLRLVASARRDRYQVPSTRDDQREGDAFLNLSWAHTAGQAVLLTVSPFFHFNRADYVGSPSPRDERASWYAGAQAVLSATTRRHSARAGVFGFGQGDQASLSVTGAGVSVMQRQNLTGSVAALFLEDQFQLEPWLTFSGGVRLTHFSGALAENAADPRAGAAIRIPRLPLVLRAYYGRFYQAPPLSTVAGPLLALAAARGFGFLPLHGERDEQVQFGARLPLRGWTLDVDRFRTRARNFLDHNVLGNSNIFFPLSIQGARIRGWEAALRSPRLFRRGQVRLAYSRQVAEGEGAVTGGLTGFSPPAGLFLLDHDQRHTLNVGFDATLPGQFWAAGNLYYGSGFADEGGPRHLPGHTALDVTVGKALGEALSVSFTVLNAANRRLLLDHSPEFGGTHYSDPRQAYLQLRYRFRY